MSACQKGQVTRHWTGGGGAEKLSQFFFFGFSFFLDLNSSFLTPPENVAV